MWRIFTTRSKKVWTFPQGFPMSMSPKVLVKVFRNQGVTFLTEYLARLVTLAGCLQGGLYKYISDCWPPPVDPSHTAYVCMVMILLLLYLIILLLLTAHPQPSFHDACIIETIHDGRSQPWRPPSHRQKKATARKRARVYLWWTTARWGEGATNYIIGRLMMASRNTERSAIIN